MLFSLEMKENNVKSLYCCHIILNQFDFMTISHLLFSCNISAKLFEDDLFVVFVLLFVFFFYHLISHKCGTIISEVNHFISFYRDYYTAITEGILFNFHHSSKI